MRKTVSVGERYWRIFARNEDPKHGWSLCCIHAYTLYTLLSDAVWRRRLTKDNYTRRLNLVKVIGNTNQSEMTMK